MKGKLYKGVVRPAMMYGLETAALTRKQEMDLKVAELRMLRFSLKLEVAELRMLRFSLGTKRSDRIRNEYIRGTAHVGSFGQNVREERLRWFGHVLRKDRGYILQRMLNLEVPGKRRGGRPKRKFIDVVNEDMRAIGVTEQDARDRVKWTKMFCCGDP